MLTKLVVTLLILVVAGFALAVLLASTGGRRAHARTVATMTR